MHDHNFEKQVHQKMEELHLTPSFAVWERVEEKLHKKKRRRFLFWIFFLLAGLFTGGYCLVQNHAEIKHQHTLSDNSSTSSYPVKESAPVKTTVTTGNPGKKAVPAAGSLHPTLIISTGTRVQSQALSAKVLQSTAHIPIYHDTNKPTGKEDKEKQPETAGMIFPDKRKESLAFIETTADRSDSESLKNPLAAIIPSALYLHESVSTAFSIHPDEKKAGQTIKLNKTKNFHWGVNLEVIRTSVNDGSLSEVFKSASTADQLAANLNPANNSGGGIIVPSTPSAIRTGTGFSTGVFLQKKLGSRWTVSTGISYTLFNTSITTGSSRASSAAQYSSSGVDRYYSLTNANDRHTYTNRYHFAGMPVLFQFRLNGEKLPVLWEGGISLSRLIASNALQYSDSLNGYYQNNRLLNRTQFSVLTGVQVKLFSRSRYPVSAGPQVQVGLSSLSAERAGNRTHLAQYGFKLSTLIK